MNTDHAKHPDGMTPKLAASAEPVAWVAADTLNSPHPTCVSSLAYMSQIDKDRGREYVPLYAAPVAAQAPRPCTCHPDDRPDGPCREKYASNECLAAAVDARDAERYRWLRRGGNDDIGVVRGFDVIEYGSSSVASTYEDSLCGDRLDAAIDAAIAQQRKGEA